MSGTGKIVAATVVVAAGALVFWAVSTVPQAPPPVKTDDSPRVMSYEDNVISEEKDGKKVWDLTAKTTKVDVDTQDAEMSDITGHYYGKDGQTVTLKADRGTYGKESKIVRLEGNIEATTTDGIKLTSAKLIWNGDEEILSAEENAVLTKEDMKVTADKIESFDGFSKVRATGNAHLEKGVRNENE